MPELIAPVLATAVTLRLTDDGSANVIAQRSNWAETLLASAASTANRVTAEQTNYNWRGVTLVLDVTANPGGAETLSLVIQVKDSIGGTWVDLVNTGAVITAADGERILQLYPGAVETIANAFLWVQAIALPRAWRAIVAHSGAGSWTYSLASYGQN